MRSFCAFLGEFGLFLWERRGKMQALQALYFLDILGQGVTASSSGFHTTHKPVTQSSTLFVVYILSITCIRIANLN